MPKRVTWFDYVIAIMNLYLAYFHFRNTTLGVVLAVAALLHLWVMKKNFGVDFL